MAASKLIGTWELQSDENINEYLKKIVCAIKNEGMALVKRKIAITMKPCISISRNDDLWCINIDMKTKGTETLFREGTEVDTSNEMKFVFDIRFYFDCRRKCRSNFKFENPDKLIQKMHFELTDENLLITREVNSEGILVETLEMDNVIAKRFFKRIA